MWSLCLLEWICIWSSLRCFGKSTASIRIRLNRMAVMKHGWTFLTVVPCKEMAVRLQMRSVAESKRNLVLRSARAFPGIRFMQSLAVTTRSRMRLQNSIVRIIRVWSGNCLYRIFSMSEDLPTGLCRSMEFIPSVIWHVRILISWWSSLVRWDLWSIHLQMDGMSHR